MMAAIRDTILILVGVATVAIQFWVLKKPIETKIAILRLSAIIAGAIAVLAAIYFQITASDFKWSSIFALCNLVIQVALFATSPGTIARTEIVSLVVAALFFATIPMYAAIGLLAKAQTQSVEIESRMAALHGKTTELLGKVIKALPEASRAATPSPTP